MIECYMFEKTNTKSYFDEFYSPTINDSPKSIGLRQNTRLLFNNPLSTLQLSYREWRRLKLAFQN